MTIYFLAYGIINNEQLEINFLVYILIPQINIWYSVYSSSSSSDQKYSGSEEPHLKKNNILISLQAKIVLNIFVVKELFL